MAETLQTLSIVSFAVAGVSLIAAVFCFLFFRIPEVIGDLSGRTARRSIARMREANERDYGKDQNGTNGERTDILPPAKTGRLEQKTEISGGRTESLNSAGAAEEETVQLRRSEIGTEETVQLRRTQTGTTEEVPSGADAVDPGDELLTEVMDTPEETAFIGQGTAVLTEETTILRNDEGETTILGKREDAPFCKLEMLEEVMIVHTDETIE